MLGARTTYVLFLSFILCLDGLGCASGTARRLESVHASSGDSASLIVELSRETEAPIAGARLLVDGEEQELSLTGGPCQLEIEPGPHRISLDLLLLRGGPRVYGRGPAYEARLRGATRVEVAAGCELLLRASTREQPSFGVRPELRFRQELTCLGTDGPIPPPPPSEPIPQQISRDELLEWSDVARRSCQRSEELVALAASVAESNEDIEQARCLEERRAAIASRRYEVDELLETIDSDDERHLRHLASAVRAQVEQIRWLQERARQCL